MFAGMKALFSGGITSGQLKIFSKRFVENKGAVAIRDKIHPMFKPKQMKPLECDINYIIVENLSINRVDLCRQLSCTDIPDNVTVVHREWLEQCLSNKKLLDVASYTVDISGKHTSPSGSRSSITKEKEGLKASAQANIRSLKRKHDDETIDNADNTIEKYDNVKNKQRQLMHFECLDAASSLENEFNTILTDAGSPSLLYKFEPLKRPFFSQLLAFDMDGTLITTKSGATFSKSIDDWKFFHPSVPVILRELHAEGAHLAIISNQNGIAKGHTTISELIQKLKAITTAIGVPIDIFCAFENDIYRKPRIGAFDFLLNQRVGAKSSAAVDPLLPLLPPPAEGYVAARDPEVLARCLYVGDAAGRPKQGTRKKDFSASDYKMAINAKIDFETPEEFFLKSKQPLHCSRKQAELGPTWTELVQSNQLAGASNEKSTATDDFKNIPEIVLLVGPPACGKSTLARRLHHTHVRVNQDILKNKKACFKVVSEHFLTLKQQQEKQQIDENQPQGVVIDATNGTRSTRKEWVDLARVYDVPIRCIQIEVTKDLCFHLAAYRLISPLSTEEDKRNIEKVVIHSYFKNMEPPRTQEGFSEIIQEKFSPLVPDEAEAARLLMSFLR